MNEKDQEIAMNVILSASDAKNYALEASKKAQEGDFEEAERLMSKSEECLNQAHHIQFQMLQDEANGNGHELCLLMVHSQDHLMNAITVVDLTRGNIELWKTIHGLKKGRIDHD